MENKVNPSSVMKVKNEAIFRHQLNTLFAHLNPCMNAKFWWCYKNYQFKKANAIFFTPKYLCLR